MSYNNQRSITGPLGLPYGLEEDTNPNRFSTNSQFSGFGDQYMHAPFPFPASGFPAMTTSMVRGQHDMPSHRHSAHESGLINHSVDLDHPVSRVQSWVEQRGNDQEDECNQGRTPDIETGWNGTIDHTQVKQTKNWDFDDTHYRVERHNPAEWSRMESQRLQKSRKSHEVERHNVSVRSEREEGLVHSKIDDTEDNTTSSQESDSSNYTRNPLMNRLNRVVPKEYRHDKNTNIYDLSEAEIKDLRQFRSIFLKPRDPRDTTLRKVLKCRTVRTNRSLLSAQVRPVNSTVFRYLDDIISGLPNESLDRWPEMSNGTLTMYLKEAKKAHDTSSPLVDRVAHIINRTCDLKLLNLLYPYLDNSKVRDKDGTQRFTERRSIFYKLKNTVPEDRDCPWFTRLPCPKNNNEFGYCVPEDDCSITELNEVRVILSKMVIKTRSTINQRMSKNSMMNMLEGIGRAMPELEDGLKHVRSRLDEVSMVTRYQVAH